MSKNIVFMIVFKIDHFSFVLKNTLQLFQGATRFESKKHQGTLIKTQLLTGRTSNCKLQQD